MANTISKDQSLTIRLGSDLKFPISGNFVPVTGVDLLLQDIQRLLLTLPGERPFRPTFGCGLRNQVWENIYTASTVGKSSILAALASFEPRISVLDVSSQINENTGLIVYNIQFLILSQDTITNLIFPFRVGTQLSTSQ